MTRMKQLVLVVLIMAGGNLVAAEKFWSQLTPEERAAAGLNALTEDQRAALDGLAERFAGEGARPAIEAARATARAEAEAQAQTGLAQEIKKRDEARIGLTGPKAAVETVRSRIVGEFRGWNGQTRFRLENGQTWVQANASDRYVLSAQPGPEVEVRQAGMGGWKLYIMPGEAWVRVKRAN